jgi:hypothetical protein
VDPAVAAGADGIPGTSDDIAQATGEFTLFGGSILDMSSYTVTGPVSGNSSTSITITFMANISDPVFAWGGHIASRPDWGVGNSAINISGAPFHMRILDSDGEGGGSQDRGLQSDAVYYPGSIVIIEQANPPTFVTDFWFDTSGSSIAGFWLDDDDQPLTHWPDTQAFTGLTRFGNLFNYDVIQTVPAPYILTLINCTSDPRGGSGVDNNTISVPLRELTVTLEEGELVTCTFVNAAPTAAKVEVTGRVVTAEGFGIRNASVVLTTTAGSRRSVVTNAFGYYRFTDIEVGSTYLLRAQSKGYGFSPRVLLVDDSLADINFTAGQ